MNKKNLPVSIQSYQILMADAYAGTIFPDGDGNYSIISLNFVTRIKQTISLSSGYQFISLNVLPEHTEMTKVFENILENIDFVKESNTHIALIDSKSLLHHHKKFR